jgi:hypothetical protein
MKDDISVSSHGENTKSDVSVTSKDIQHASSVRGVLGQKESQLVWRSRIMVLFVLLVATIGVSIVTYYFTEREQKHDFKTRVSLFWTTNVKLLLLLLTF